jgi:hypothetical protein
MGKRPNQSGPLDGEHVNSNLTRPCPWFKPMVKHYHHNDPAI